MIDLFSITVVLARCLALYILVNATFSIPSLFSFFKQTTETGLRFSSDGIILVITAVAYATIALLLLIYAKNFAGYVTRGLDRSATQISEDNLGILQSVGFSLLGAYVLTYAIPSLIKMATLYVWPSTPTETDIFYPTAQRQIPIDYLTQAVTQLVLGIWLLVGSRVIVRMIRRGWDNIKAE